MKPPITLSVVIPVYNEEKRLYKTFEALNSFDFAQFFSSTEIIFVDDGSTDATASIVQSAKLRYPHRLISYKPNRGKGRAVRLGMEASAYDFALLCDADMS